MSLIRATNNLFQSLEPWKLKKEGQIDKFTATMAVSLETVRIVGILLQPIIPSFSQRLLGKKSDFNIYITNFISIIFYRML